MMTVESLRGATAAVWLVACLCLLRPALRALFWRERPGDEWKAFMFFAGLLFFAFPSRQMIRPSDDTARESLFVLSITLALTVIAKLWRDWRDRRAA